MRESLARRLGDSAYTFLGAKDAGELVGSATGIVCDSLYGECRPFMVVEDFVVDSTRVRQGIGSALMRSLEQFASSRGCSQVILVTENERADAVAFYESLGFESGPYRGFKKRLVCG